MPVVLDRLPLPNLTWYTGLSVVLLACSVYYAGVQVTLNPNWKERLLEKTTATDDEVSLYHVSGGGHEAPGGEGRHMTPYLIPEVISFMFHEPLCIWTLINIAYCVLILLGTLIQRLVFGELRVSEQQHIKDKFWNFVFYKFIFVFGVMNVQAMDEVVLWCSWFSVLGFLHLLAQLCKDRFEYLSFSATTPRRTHIRLLGLLSIILTIATFCLFICVVVGCHSGFNTFAFMVAECILLIVRTLYVITRYCIYLWDVTHEGLWEKRGRYVYFTELVFELSELVIDMVHHIHMLVWGNMFLTMASLVICMQLRLLFYQLQHKVKSHRNYLRVLQLMNMYPEVSGADILAEDSTCAICWEHQETGRCLPCSHVFHASCLLAWLHQDLSCPTCRHKLHKPEPNETASLLDGLLPTVEENGLGQDNRVNDAHGAGSPFPSPAAPEGSGTPGWRYVSWLPSFSVEQSHTQLPRHQQASAQPASTSQLDGLARQVQQMFPDVSYSHILEDLRHTHSLEVTIDNILEQRLVNPPPMFTSHNSHSSLYDGTHEEAENSPQSNVDEDVIEEEEHFQDALPLLQNKSCLPELSLKTSSSSCEDSSDTDSDGWSPVGSFGTGGRFSKSPREREQMLAQRKSALVSQARRRFVSHSRGDIEEGDGEALHEDGSLDTSQTMGIPSRHKSSSPSYSFFFFWGVG
ncbi:E3 ubiquitin-protein ligase AMFR-like isoform X2 [Portunus trituberculatus]|uniref:E3 ubiquitin-protein ligase AMFR-like isoform X2 n=1 Tax=Portunus trituberculatus TaxID=210409 RepID=UPI001E1D174B|nr:E3 ubiquitin-protein ligase AMFR-like isoform X2 [Portunus trituberculatus]